MSCDLVKLLFKTLHIAITFLTFIINWCQRTDIYRDIFIHLKIKPHPNEKKSIMLNKFIKKKQIPVWFCVNNKIEK